MWRMRIACWIPTSTNTQYVILIAFPLQQWLHEGTSMLRYTYSACLAMPGMASVYCSVGTVTLHKRDIFHL